MGCLSFSLILLLVQQTMNTNSDENPSSSTRGGEEEVLSFAKDLNLGALEIYKIEAINISPDRKFKVIQIVSCGLDVIYKRGKDDIPINKPLLLCGPSRCHSGLAYIDIQIGSFDWDWRVFIGEEICPTYLPITVDITDKVTGSTVRAYIEHIPKAAQAHFNFSFSFGEDEDESRTISITKAIITANTVGEHQNKKMIGLVDELWARRRMFWKPLLTERPAITLLSVGHDSKTQQLSAGEKIQLNRSVIGLPLRFTLRVAVDITFMVEEPGKNNRKSRISGTVDINVPKKPCTNEIWFGQEGAKNPKVKMVIDWKNDTKPYSNR